jgi:hypothetical protein
MDIALKFFNNIRLKADGAHEHWNGCSYCRIECSRAPDYATANSSLTGYALLSANMTGKRHCVAIRDIARDMDNAPDMPRKAFG